MSEEKKSDGHGALDPFAERRVDPVLRHVEQEYTSGTGLRRQDITRKYVLVNGNSEISRFRYMGYRIEVYEKEGVRLMMDDLPLDKTGERSEGQPIQFQGHVLMSIPKEKHAHLYQNGSPFWGSGQKRFDELEKLIKSPNFDPVKMAGMKVVQEGKDVVK